MDARFIDENGLTVCPNCKKHYTPVLICRPTGDTRSIQDIFPHAPPWQREQLISGLCSDKCWDEYLGVGSDFDDEEDDIE